MAQLIMIKIDEGELSERLAAAVATDFDAETGTVFLADPVKVTREADPGIMIHKDLCYEFDERVLQDINGLVTAAVDKLDVAHKIMNIALAPAEFETAPRPALIVH